MVCFQMASFLSAILWASAVRPAAMDKVPSGYCPSGPQGILTARPPHTELCPVPPEYPRTPALIQHLKDSYLLRPRRWLEHFDGKVLSHICALSSPLLYCSQAIYVVAKSLGPLTYGGASWSIHLSFHWFALKWHKGQMLLLFHKPNTRGWSRHITLITTSILSSTPVYPEQEAQELGSQKFWSV